MGHTMNRSEPTNAIVELTTDHEARPVVRVLLSDGRTTEFREKAIVIPEGPRIDQPANDGRVYALLIDSNGTPYETPDGNYAVVDVPVLQLGTTQQPDEPLTWKEVAQRAGVSLSSVKRAADAGHIPKPQPVPGMERAVRFKASDVEAWIKGNRTNEASKTKA